MATTIDLSKSGTRVKSDDESMKEETDEPEGSSKLNTSKIGNLDFDDILQFKYGKQKNVNPKRRGTVSIIINTEEEGLDEVESNHIIPEVEDEQSVSINPSNTGRRRADSVGVALNVHNSSRNEELTNTTISQLPLAEVMKARQNKKETSYESEEGEYTEYCVFIRVPYQVYSSFAFCSLRREENVFQILGDVIPYFKDLSKVKKQNILNSFQEMEFVGGVGGYKPGHVLEEEGHPTQNIYIILRG